MRTFAFGALAAMLCCAPSGGLAQEAEPSLAVAEAPAPDPVLVGEPLERLATVPALTEIAVEILADLGSRTSKQGDTFPLRLAAPIVVEGVELVPAGATGVGEVIHAKKSGGGGTGGELILAARYLETGDGQIPLRSLRVDPTVKDRIGTVQAINVASAAFVPGLSLVGFLIKGDQLSIPAGSILSAKTAADFSVGLPAPADAAPVEVPASATSPLEAPAPVAETDFATEGETQ